jgi:hypothetical protein
VIVVSEPEGSILFEIESLEARDRYYPRPEDAFTFTAPESLAVTK